MDTHKHTYTYSDKLTHTHSHSLSPSPVPPLPAPISLSPSYTWQTCMYDSIHFLPYNHLSPHTRHYSQEKQRKTVKKHTVTHSVDKSSDVHSRVLGYLAVPFGHAHGELDPLDAAERFQLVQVSSNLSALAQHLESLLPVGYLVASADGLEEGPHDLVVKVVVLRLGVVVVVSLTRLLQGE